jgi:aryl-alcohol dehydrogenase-like predicted oxidoreductase
VESDRIAAALAPFLPAGRLGEPLSRKALWVAASTPGVSAVLVGMRAADYVRDALAVLRWPPLDDVRPIYDALDPGAGRREQRG